jgi:hypothetical protein
MLIDALIDLGPQPHADSHRVSVAVCPGHFQKKSPELIIIQPEDLSSPPRHSTLDKRSMVQRSILLSYVVQ